MKDNIEECILVPNFLLDLIHREKLSSRGFVVLVFIISRMNEPGFVLYKKMIINYFNLSDWGWRCLSEELRDLNFIELKLNEDQQYYICVDKLRERVKK